MPRKRTLSAKDIRQHFKNKFETKRRWYLLWFGALCFLLVKACWDASEVLPNVELGPMIFLLFIVGLVCAFFGFTKNTRQVRGIIEDDEIYSLSNKSSVHGGGAFILGFGGISIDEEEYYVFYKKGQFGLVKERVPCDEVELVMHNDVKPSLKTIMVPDAAHDDTDTDPSWEEKTFLFVPKNTVKKHIRLTT